MHTTMKKSLDSDQLCCEINADGQP